MNQVGRYQIVEEIGRGAMGVVYRALDPKIGRTIAIKTIRLSDLTDPSERARVRERLLREAQSAGLLSHPNIVTIYDILEEQDVAHIFMEYVDGSSLEKMVRSRELPARDILLKLLRQVAGALDYAHEKGVIHRDIKPANILIAKTSPSTEPFAKITDFGVAKFISQELTHSGTMMGTPNYMSPEQIQGSTLSERTDQFSLAVMIWEILAGQKPFAADNLPALFFLVCKEEPKPIHDLNKTLTEDVDRALRRALNKDAEGRFVSCSDFLAALSTALGHVPDWKTGEAAGWNAGDVTGFGATVGSVAAETPSPIVREQITPVPYELPALRRRRRDEDPDKEPAPVMVEEAAPKAGARKWVLIGSIAILLIGAAVFVASWKPRPDLPVQVLDTKTGDIVPPTEDVTQANNRHEKEKRKDAARAVEKSRPAQVAKVQKPQPTPTFTGAGTADVDLLSEPPGARIVVDGNSQNACTAPCTVTLPNGRHTLVAEANGFTVARRVFNVPGQNSVFVAMTKSTGVLIVTSFPSGAQVMVDGKDYGHTPATIHLSAGRHRLVLVNGPLRHEENLDVETDGFVTRSYHWEDQ